MFAGKGNGHKRPDYMRLYKSIDCGVSCLNPLDIRKCFLFCFKCTRKK